MYEADEQFVLQKKFQNGSQEPSQKNFSGITFQYTKSTKGRAKFPPSPRHGPLLPSLLYQK
jgi:hypothetical protein